jgi:hypothetical protein
MQLAAGVTEGCRTARVTLPHSSAVRKGVRCHLVAWRHGSVSGGVIDGASYRG